MAHKLLFPSTMLRAGLSTAALLLVLAGCSSDSARPEAPASPSVSSDVEAIKVQSQRLSEAYVRGDIESLVSIYTPDGVAIPGASDVVRGRSALQDLWALPEGMTILRHAATPTELRVDGDHAYDWGHYEGQAAQDGEPLDPFGGTYVIVWERGADGIWRIAVDMWNSLGD